MKVLTQGIAASLASTLFLVGCGGGSSSIERLVEDTIQESQQKEIRNEIEQVMDRFHIPGVSVALVANKRVVFSEGFGFTHLDAGKAVTGDTSFWLGSTSKAVAGVALMRAQEQGLLSLDDHVQTLLANDSGMNLSLPHTHPVLLRHLVSHTSTIVDTDNYDCAYFVGEEQGEHYSLANAFIGGDCNEDTPVDLAGYLNAYLSESGAYYSAADNFLLAEPGASFEYSNIASALAGYTLESVTGTSLADYAMEHIFSPLGMNNTSWKRSDLVLEDIATPHVWDDESAAMVDLPIYDLSTWPDGGLRSSADDLAKLLLAIMQQGELPAGEQQAVRVLAQGSVATLLEPLVEGLGLEVGVFWMTTETYTGRKVVGHAGSDPGAYSFMFFDPKEQVGVVLMGNGDDEFDDTFENAHGQLIETLLDAAEVLAVVD